MKVYISGAISTDADHLDHFQRTALALRGEGHIVMSPTCLPCGFAYEDYMHVCFAMIDVCDCVYLMHNWQDSPGACREKLYAESKRKRVVIGKHSKPYLEVKL
jgi:hypothetical protein